MRKIILAATLVALASCTTTEQANKLVAEKYQGTPSDAFFIKYGPPSSRYTLKSGDTLYTWGEPPKYWQSPSAAHTTVIGSRAITTVTPGGTNVMQCQLKIVVSSSGTIKDINVLADSLGAWQISRCNELFSR